MTLHEKIDLLISNGITGEGDIDHQIAIFHHEGYNNADSIDAYFQTGTSKISNFTGFKTKNYGTFDVVDLEGNVQIMYIRTRENKDHDVQNNVNITINGTKYALIPKSIINVTFTHIQTIRIDFPYTKIGYFGDLIVFVR